MKDCLFVNKYQEYAYFLNIYFKDVFKMET
jgi:hypothetical protein